MRPYANCFSWIQLANSRNSRKFSAGNCPQQPKQISKGGPNARISTVRNLYINLIELEDTPSVNYNAICHCGVVGLRFCSTTNFGGVFEPRQPAFEQISKRIWQLLLLLSPLSFLLPVYRDELRKSCKKMRVFAAL